MSTDVVIAGGGVIGLSLARKLARAGRSVTLIERQQLGQEASWAGAGILPPGNLSGATAPFDRLRALSVQMWPQLSRHLFEETGLDNGFWDCGGLTVSLGETLSEPYRREWSEEGVELEELDGAGLRRYESELSTEISEGFRLPGLCQVRNPWHLQTLAEACRKAGVVLRENEPVRSFQQDGGRITSVETDRGKIEADQFCVTAGAWTSKLLQDAGYTLSIVPIRGQIVLYKTDTPVIRHVIEVGKRYLVPRDDGRLLVGSTEEEAGFEKVTTEESLAELQRFAVELVPALGSATVEKTWAGLRPMSQTGSPFLGLLPGMDNLFVAAGHFRAGLQTSPATGLVMKQLMCGEPTALDLDGFSVDASCVESSS
ncbi:MAG: glycine oxidase ThiO [Planctomycetaceae bacterium]|nr:glycine oxidase ThiO [Planctomycetaceae bacterium]